MRPVTGLATGAFEGVFDASEPGSDAELSSSAAGGAGEGERELVSDSELAGGGVGCFVAFDEEDFFPILACVLQRGWYEVGEGEEAREARAVEDRFAEDANRLDKLKDATRPSAAPSFTFYQPLTNQLEMELEPPPPEQPPPPALKLSSELLHSIFIHLDSPKPFNTVCKAWHTASKDPYVRSMIHS